MQNYKDLLHKVLAEGSHRNTRSGETISMFGEFLEWDMREGFPAVTTKKLAWKSVVGELLWFINGETTLEALRHRSDLSPNAWTIWDDDAKRWNQSDDYDDLGKLYGYQWRSAGGYVDQLQNLVDKIMCEPNSRYLLVMSWNSVDVAQFTMALPPCHTGFQVYVDGPYMDLMWNQRSIDTFLGLPFNIASYGLLLEILCSMTGHRPRKLKCSLGDVHIYLDQISMVEELLSRRPMTLPTVSLPNIVKLDDLKEMTAKDFELVGYQSHPPIKAPLSVGE